MNINVSNTIILDDLKEYVVASKVEYNGCIYVYILEVGNPNNYKFAEVENDEVSIIEPEEKELLSNLMPLFELDANKTLTEIINNNN